MIHKNIWKPDTCKCQIEYQWDDLVDVKDRVHTVSKIIYACPVHQGNTKEECYDTVLDENQRKNILHGEILKIPTVVQEKIQDDGNTIKELKAGLKYDWSFDKDRNLEVDLVGFSGTDKNTVEILASSLFGSKVIIK